MGIRATRVGRENFKTIFKLQAYQIVSLSKPAYRLDEDGRPEDYRNKPGFLPNPDNFIPFQQGKGIKECKKSSPKTADT